MGEIRFPGSRGETFAGAHCVVVVVHDEALRLESVDALRVGQQQQDCDGGVWRVLNSNPSCASAVAPSAERGVADGDGTAEQHCGRG